MLDNFTPELMKLIDNKFKGNSKHGIVYKAGRVYESAGSGSAVIDFVVSPESKGSVGYAIKGKITEIMGMESCLSEETYITYQRRDLEKGEVVGKGGGSISELYKEFKKFNSNPKLVDYFVPSVDELEEYVYYQKIKDVVKTGLKKCYRVTTKEGKSLVSTKKHRYRVGSDEYERLEDLKVGEEVYIHNNTLSTCESKTPTFTPVKDEIVSIEYLGYRETYDIKCYAPNHNYIAHGIVVHNSGKSTSIYSTSVEALKKGWNVLLIDSEGSFDASYAGALGLHIGKNFQVVRPLFGEDVDKIINMLMGWGKGNSKTRMRLDMVLCDSVATIKPRALLESEDSTGKGEMKSLHATYWGNLVAKMNMIAQDREVAFVLVNQLRDKFSIESGFQEKTIKSPNSLASGLNNDNSKYATGGNGIKFFASIRLLFQHGRRPKVEREIRGKKVEAKSDITYIRVQAIKNKVFSPHLEGVTAIQYGKGFRDELPMFDFLKDLDVITTNSSGVYTIKTKQLSLEVKGIRNFQKELFSEHMEAFKKVYLKAKYKEFKEMYDRGDLEAMDDLLDGEEYLEEGEEYLDLEEKPKPKTRAKSKPKTSGHAKKIKSLKKK